jgi:hypothetical protein
VTGLGGALPLRKTLLLLGALAGLAPTLAAGEPPKAADSTAILDLERGSFVGFARWKTPSVVAKDGKPIIATPDIPLGWPLSAGASEKRIYVGDLYNRRVVRVDRKFAAEETCEIR